MLRWAIPTSEVTDGSFDPLLKLLPQEDADAVLKFRNADDSKRALLSRLTQRAAPSAALALPAAAASSSRRRRAADGRGRPFLCRRSATAALSSAADHEDARDALAAAPNWNYSASHEGRWVVLASEPLALCGADVAAPRRLERRGRAGGFLASVALLRDSFTDTEWAAVQGPILAAKAASSGGGSGSGGNDGSNDSNDDEAECRSEAAFLRLWAVKEAFVKARGDGLAFAPLGRIEAVWNEDSTRAFDDPGRVAAAAASGACLAVGTLSVDCSAPLWGRWAVAVHPLPVEEDGEEMEEAQEEEEEGVAAAEKTLSPRTPGVSPVPPPSHAPRHRHRCWLVVVRGPPSETAPRDLHPDFCDSLARRSLDGDELRRAVQDSPWPPVRVLKVGDLFLDEVEREAVATALAERGASRAQSGDG